MPLGGLLVAFVVVGLCSHAALAQQPSAQIQASTPKDEPIPGFWPTPRMIDGVVRRWAAEATATYDLNDKQAADVESKLLDRWTGFLESNRRDLQPLVNEYIESRLALEPPTSDEVARWAAKAMPVYQRLRTNIEEGEAEVRTLLDDEQRTRFDTRRAQRWAGLEVLESSLKRWSVGNFKRNEWWDPPPGWQEREQSTGDESAIPARIAAAESAATTDADQVPDRVEGELHAWEKYVDDYCNAFDLDRSQRNAAHSILRELLERARSYVVTRRDRIDALERMIADPATTDRDKVNRELEELYGPLDRMFAELEDRLRRLPTDAQSRRAAQTPPPLTKPRP